MTVLKIIQYPDKLLRRKSQPVTNVLDNKVQQMASDMLATLKKTKNCAALASTQLDLEHPLDMIAVNPVPGEAIFKKHPMVFINPKLTKIGPIVSDLEGCMSICPNRFSAPVPRFEKVVLDALDCEGNAIHLETSGFLARCLQHECDHLVGKLFIDYLPPEAINQLAKSYEAR